MRRSREEGKCVINKVYINNIVAKIDRFRIDFKVLYVSKNIQAIFKSREAKNSLKKNHQQ